MKRYQINHFLIILFPCFLIGILASFLLGIWYNWGTLVKLEIAFIIGIVLALILTFLQKPPSQQSETRK
ncbi:MAG: hypothetical protein N3A63_02310 [Bacteroidetes bacterium]|nr:hypothetical protein [Bacteroidota bacterium]